MVSLTTVPDASFRPFRITGFPASPGPGPMTNEEKLSRGRALMLEGMGLFDSVHASGCSGCASLPLVEADRDKLRAALNGFRRGINDLLAEKERLMKEKEVAVEKSVFNQGLLDEALRDRNESMGRELDAKVQLATVTEERDVSRRQAKSLHRQLEDVRNDHQLKVAELESSLLHYQRLLEKERKLVVEQRGLLEDFKASTPSSPPASDQSVADLTWMRQEGVPMIVRSVLRSPEFAQAFSDIQKMAMHLGRAQGCALMRDSHPDVLGNAMLPYVIGNERVELIEKFKNLVQRPYSIVEFVKGADVDFSTLRAELIRTRPKEIVVPRGPVASGLGESSHGAGKSVEEGSGVGGVGGSAGEAAKGTKGSSGV